ncbi:DUF1707 SHOCT-like domain-containing protein [Naumannella halotolerans]|uniref:Uncharacterized protein DUF1707 n=1 Tax=Naumannella halotolerans TaxID=993414 RepID=A0A4R7J6W4_9ACTN|nr:DUF1707 domain-containing protein [Naumannella halotolerans]TDT33152.1 uncharacterized protein DUF1707 [Naumannella halotolerans]
MAGGEMRIGHAERDAVVDDLRNAAAEGRLTLEELDQRLEAALEARTLSDLDPLVADLPVSPPSRRFDPRSAQPVAARPSLPRPAGLDPRDRLRLDGGMSTVRRTGYWEIPPFLRIESGMGSVILDCLQARPLAPVIDIEMIPGAGTVKIIVPDGWAANTDRLSSAWGTAASAVSTTPAPHSPILVLHGGVGMGTLKIRNATGRERRRLERTRLPGEPGRRELPG